MTNKANDILVDYEGLLGQLADLQGTLDLVGTGFGNATDMAIINTVRYALKDLKAEHESLSKKHREEI
ncbi:hypothetical protein [Streptococcus merionis]|uniref:Uncharacterized protein n=1 Tax=Streptococcus merionis TaxID=400065 RepID=A0A239SZC5_9STRE|nr:hypothetical protein [Streptococcus merionis]QBX08770.1 hypothetical protein JavanS294_0011 [Streptococcus satellite phage Javan294]SNU90589.1 Uncharacterised protein [Streptococcus merionis]